MMKQLPKKNIAQCGTVLSLLIASNVFAQTALPAYDLLLQQGHVIDAKNHIDSVMDVAIKDGKIARVAQHIPSGDALKSIDAKGLYVTPGLIDLHVHVMAGLGDFCVEADQVGVGMGVPVLVDGGTSA